MADGSGLGHSTPESMADLELEKYPLLSDALNVMVEQAGQAGGGSLAATPGYALGAVLEGLPSAPHLPCSNGYWMQGLPSPRLGSIARREVEEELRNDPGKDARQRRDFGFPDGHVAARIRLLGYTAYLVCLTVELRSSKMKLSSRCSSLWRGQGFSRPISPS